MTPLQRVTFDQIEWTGGLSGVLITSVLTWSVFSLLSLLWSGSQFGLFELPFDENDAKWLYFFMKFKLIWLDTPINALVTPLSTVLLREDCSHIATTNIPDLQTYGLVLGFMAGYGLVFAMSICLYPICDSCFGVLVVILPFFFAMPGALLKWEDFSFNGFTASLIFGIDPTIVFRFVWPSKLISLHIMRVILLFKVMADWLDALAQILKKISSK